MACPHSNIFNIAKSLVTFLLVPAFSLSNEAGKALNTETEDQRKIVKFLTTQKEQKKPDTRTSILPNYFQYFKQNDLFRHNITVTRFFLLQSLTKKNPLESKYLFCLKSDFFSFFKIWKLTFLKQKDEFLPQ